MFVRHESFNQFVRYYPAVAGIVAINAVLYLLSFFPLLYQVVYSFGVGSNYHVLEFHQYWRLVTPIFLHAGFAHFLFNNFSLVIFGPDLERILGKGKFIFLYLFAGIVGNVGTLLLGGAGFNLHLGASGAIYGLLGLYIYMSINRKELIDPQSAQIVKAMLLIGILYTFISPNINIYAHLFGFLGGFIAGHFIFKPLKFNKKPTITKKRTVKNSDDDNKVIYLDPNRRKDDNKE